MGTDDLCGCSVERLWEERGEAWEAENADALARAERAEAALRRAEPVLDAVRRWRTAELPPDAHNKVFAALNALAIAWDAYAHPEDLASNGGAKQEGTQLNDHEIRKAALDYATWLCGHGEAKTTTAEFIDAADAIANWLRDGTKPTDADQNEEITR